MLMEMEWKIFMLTKYKMTGPLAVWVCVGVCGSVRARLYFLVVNFVKLLLYICVLWGHFGQSSQLQRVFWGLS